MSRLWAFTLVGLYLLASARALVPDLCLTMRAVDEQAAACAPAPAGHGCCAVPQAAPDSAQAPGAPVEKRCPFCHLAKALVEPLEHVVLAAPVTEVFEHLQAVGSDPLLEAVAQSHPGRAPPVKA